MIRPVIVCLLFALSGCGSVPLTSMLKLSQLDPLSAEAEHIRIGVRLRGEYPVGETNLT